MKNKTPKKKPTVKKKTENITVDTSNLCDGFTAVSSTIGSASIDKSSVSGLNESLTRIEENIDSVLTTSLKVNVAVHNKFNEIDSEIKTIKEWGEDSYQLIKINAKHCEGLDLELKKNKEDTEKCFDNVIKCLDSDRRSIADLYKKHFSTITGLQIAFTVNALALFGTWIYLIFKH